MAITTKQQRQQRRNEALKQITEDVLDDCDAANDLRDRLQSALDAAGTGGMTNPSANQSRPPRPGAYRYCACVSWAWPVQGSMEAESAQKAGQVLPASLLDKESPAGEWAPIPLQAVLSAPITPVIPFARIT